MSYNCDTFKTKSLSVELNRHTLRKEKTMNKPPLGIIPKTIHDQGRTVDILEAMKRYVNMDKAIPAEWIDELIHLYREPAVDYYVNCEKNG